ncbi:NifU N-terminal domain-containing protein [Staphylococcus xylosus]|uniref:Scaffolding protein n=1 Tax=Staphylococcus xylosus TaxID=1288 RepID=A0AAQ0M1D3_STAXY|nr:NifU N-terminal domain-containing protein [Staphylococcus xylosus]AID01381.1 scaffolding protein [Staphylococcus xylosus]ARD74545.1 scaffolding protein [Staphylococcus xylosus]KTW23740.1 scaffolding protein [Staphylococcus xylosus]MBF0809738.1 NifU N-terminal domain-containing protein [Staphylococcus xylosus]MBO3073726.1 NifU N-terminal domain-containing protein [Staphylococcus xylosus]
MEIVEVSQTPNPNTMKIVLQLSGEDYKPNTYTSVKDGQPDFINAILELEGIKSIFQAMNFISVDKNSDSNWDDLLPRVTETLEHI